MMSALLLVPLLLVSALAIDIGALQLTGQRLQASSDLAALAGAQRQAEGASESDIVQEVDRALKADGIDLGEVSRSVSINAEGDVSVNLRQWWEPVAFGSLVVNGFNVNRDSTATGGTCIGVCKQPIVFTPDIPDLPAKGSGDGFRPAIADDLSKILTLNHHLPWKAGQTGLRQLVCVDVATKSSCEGFPMHVPTSTNDSVSIEWYHPRREVWYPLQQTDADGSQTRQGFGCVDVERAATCGEYFLRIFPYGYDQTYVNWRRIRAWGTNPMLVGDQLFGVAEDLSVMCLDLSTKTKCAGYPVKPKEWRDFESRDLIGFIPNLSDRTEGAEIVINGKLYFSWPLTDGSAMFCWDPARKAPCSDFPAIPTLNVRVTRSAVFDVPDANGNPNLICVMSGYADLRCYKLNGGQQVKVKSLDEALPPMECPGGRCWARPTRVGDRLFIASFGAKRIYCTDVVANKPCGQFEPPLRPYAFDKVPGRDCLTTGFHGGIFMTFSVRDLGPCGPDDANVELFPCKCANGDFAWASIRIDPDFLSKFSKFEITIRNQSRKVVAGPVDVVSTGGLVDLSSIDERNSRLYMSYRPVLKPGVEWKASFVGEMSLSSRPSLIE